MPQRTRYISGAEYDCIPLRAGAGMGRDMIYQHSSAVF